MVCNLPMNFLATELIINRMTDEDIPEVLAIETASFTVPWSETLFMNELRSPLARPVVARHNNRIAGYLCSSLVLDEGHILDVAVHPSGRRQGLGRRLLQETLDHLGQQGCRIVFLEVRASHTGVIGFYEQAGFRVIQTRKCYYVSPIDDAAIMELRFSVPGNR
ncbi:MAG: ribosomal-protein-alanine N-acetyltransferase [Thermodesulfovibrio sp.]|nr:ribosomal-protein-alanine N-acetyltransferase [Thermodesulfovibrio sp.]